MSEIFTPLDTLRDIFRFWWYIALTIILGGIAGWIFFSLRPPIYESKASISISIDYVYTGKLTDIEEDHALGVVGDILFTSEVMEAVVLQAQSEGWEVSLDQLLSSVYPERRFYVWQIRVQNENPDLAAHLANLWLEEASRELANAAQHAKNADSFQRTVDALESCFHAVTSEPVHAFCNMQNLEDIQTELANTGNQVQQEILASQGVLAGTGFVVSEKGYPARKPMLFGRNIVIFSGMMIGFLAGIVGISIRFPNTLFSRPRHE
jgi:capsular polysaccharide biosynthesis protein